MDCSCSSLAPGANLNRAVSVEVWSGNKQKNEEDLPQDRKKQVQLSSQTEALIFEDFVKEFVERS